MLFAVNFPALLEQNVEFFVYGYSFAKRFLYYVGVL